jgi:hypothetical protein
VNAQMYDVISRKFLSTENKDNKSFSIPPKSSRLIVEIPAGVKLSNKNGRLYAGDIIVAYD